MDIRLKCRGTQSNGSDDDRRDEPRVPIELKVEYKKLNTFFADYTKNICKGGTFIRTKKPLDIGTVFVFQLGVPKLQGADRDPRRGQVGQARGRAVAARRRRGPRAGHGHPLHLRRRPRSATALEGAVEKMMIDSLGQLLYSKLMGKDRGKRLTADAPATARWRYLVPNAFTAASIVFAVLAIEAAIAGRIVAGGVVGRCTARSTDDSTAPRPRRSRRRASSACSSTRWPIWSSSAWRRRRVFYAFYARHPALGWATPPARARAASRCAWPGRWRRRCGWRASTWPRRAAPVAHYLGTPSTMTAGIVGVAFLTALKYSDPSWIAPETCDPWRLLGGARLDAALPWCRSLLAVGAVGMLSPLRVPKLGRTRSRALTVVLAVTVASGYAAGLFHRLPEYMLAGGLVYLGACVVFHLRTSVARLAPCRSSSSSSDLRPVAVEQARQRAIGEQLAAGLAGRAVVGLVLGVADALHRRAADRARLAVLAVHRHLRAERGHLLGERRRPTRARRRSVHSASSACVAVVAAARSASSVELAATAPPARACARCRISSE